MCEPATLAIIAGATQAAGTLYGGLQANAQGKYEAQMAKRNSAMEVEAARESREIGQSERRDFWRQVGKVRGQNVASMAANGIDVGFGSAERMRSDTDMLAREDAQNLYRNIEGRTKGHLINASNFTQEAKASRSRGKAALVGSFFGAASSLMGGFQQAGSMRAKVGA